MNTIYYNLEESPLFEPTDLIESWSIDYSIFSLKYRTFTNAHELWRRFIRS